MGGGDRSRWGSSCRNPAWLLRTLQRSLKGRARGPDARRLAAVFEFTADVHVEIEKNSYLSTDGLFLQLILFFIVLSEVSSLNLVPFFVCFFKSR